VLNESEGRVTLEGCRADHSTFPAEIAWARLDAPANEGYLVIVRDLTERNRAETRLRERDTALARAMRFAVAGELASALAHELNQPITALVSYLRASEILAAPIASQDERLQATLVKAVQEAIRASEVLRRLRDFYQTGTIKRETVYVAAVSSAAADAFRDRMESSKVQFSLIVSEGLPTVETGGTQLEIVLHNLLLNAIDAVILSDDANRRIELSASCTDEEVLVQVADSGPGIAPDLMQKLFEPFMTSKPDGMGLGLAISRSLLRAQGGELEYRISTALGGACFVIRLPRHRVLEGIS
jgi:two-component system sensor kinase FixL